MRLKVYQILHKETLVYLKTAIEITQNETWRETNNLESEKCISQLWDNFKWHNICAIEVPKGAMETEKIFKDIMSTNFSNLMKIINPKIHETQ